MRPPGEVPEFNVITVVVAVVIIVAIVVYISMKKGFLKKHKHLQKIVDMFRGKK